MCRASLLALVLVVLCRATALGSDADLSGTAGHPRTRLPLALHAASTGDAGLDAVVRQAVADWLLDVRGGEGVEGADEVVERQPRHRVAPDELRQVPAAEVRAEEVAEVAGEEVRAVGVVAVQAVELAVSVVNGGVERAGHNQGRQRRDRLG